MSKESSVVDMNGTIGVFMGFTNKTGALPVYNVPSGEELKYKAFSLHVKNMPYHTDYNWLHSAWVKFRELEFDEYSIDHDIHGTYTLSFKEVLTYSGIKEAHKALYDAICWFNQTVKNNQSNEGTR